MNAADVLLAVLVLAVGAALAWRSRPVARVMLFGSTLLVSGLLFLPGDQITGLVGDDAVQTLRRWARATPWSVSDWTHFVIFVWLGLLLWFGRSDLRGWKAWGLVAVLAVAAELAQGLAPGRDPQLEDVLLNLVGGVAGLLLGMGLRRAVAGNGTRTR